MADEIEIPEEFGGSWAAFLREWCLESPIGYSPAEVSRSLSTLKRLWPEEVARIVGAAVRGTAPSVSAIDYGLLLETCDTAKYFRRVLDRLKLGQRSAYSELVLVAALLRLGLVPQFEAPVEGSMPDAHCTVDDVPISFEVYAPDRSYASQEQQQLARELQAAVSCEVSKSRVEIGLLDTFGKDQIRAAVEVIRSAAPGTWTNVGDWARIRRVDEGQSLPPLFDADGAQIVVGGEATTQGPSAGSVIRWEESDKRAEAALQKKRAQLSDGVANVLAIDACGVGGLDEWPEVIARLLPSGYEKIGAVAFFDQGILGPPESIRRRWRIVVNPSAQVAIPEALLSDLESLDESSHWGLVRKQRLVAGETGAENGSANSERRIPRHYVANFRVTPKA